jgi:hypothetical protein
MASNTEAGERRAERVAIWLHFLLSLFGKNNVG